jgi:hypothetical protein
MGLTSITSSTRAERGGMKDEPISFDVIAIGEWVCKKKIKPTELLEGMMHTFWRHLPHGFPGGRIAF